jgi:hypothetical protein
MNLELVSHDFVILSPVWECRESAFERFYGNDSFLHQPRETCVRPKAGIRVVGCVDFAGNSGARLGRRVSAED